MRKGLSASEPYPSDMAPCPEADEKDVVAEILRAVRGIRFGSVEIVIHDSKVVQIERRDRVRFERVRMKEGR